jgi:signal peptidase I
VEAKRGLVARAGIVFLNLVAPGLGLLRLGRWKAAAVIYSVTLMALLFFIAAPEVPFAVLALVTAAVVSSVVVALWLSWRWSKRAPILKPWYTRWYVITAAAVIALAISLIATQPGRVLYRFFYSPTDSGAPTLLMGDRFVAYMRSPRQIRPGQLLLVRTEHGDLYVKRVAAVAGERIGLKGGIVWVNGVPTPQHFVRNERVEFSGEVDIARRLTEKFAGESTPHEIFDLGESEGDNIAEQTVRPGHIFVLGDNRDRSVDSRFGREMMGLEEVPISHVAGYLLYVSWGSNRPMGTRLT